MKKPLSELLSEPGREWTPHAPADESELAELIAMLPFELPPEYIELLRYCDGGEGDVDAPCLLFMLDSIAAAVEHNEMWRNEDCFADFWFIGGNGGVEKIAFDLRAGPPWPVVMIDCIAGEDSAQQIASTMAEFVQKIGLVADDPEA